MDITFLRDVIFFGKYSSFFCNCTVIDDNASRCSCWTVAVSEAVVLIALVTLAVAITVAVAAYVLKRRGKDL